MMTKNGETGLKMTRTGGSASTSTSAAAAGATVTTSPSQVTTGSSNVKRENDGNGSGDAGVSTNDESGKNGKDGGGNGKGGTSSASVASTSPASKSEVRHRPASTGAQSNNKKQKGTGSGVGPSSSSGKNNVTNTNNETHSQNGHSEETVVNNSVPSRPNKQCCLCWCCCCSCSGLTFRGNQDNKEKHKDPDSDLNCDSEPQPSLEEIRTWGDSFERLMRHSGGRKVFREFLKCEYSEENILFWLACEDLKKESKPELVEEKARLIYEDYISILSPKEVSLDSRVREVVNQNMMDPSPHTFDEAQLQIFTLMHRDSYPRFVNSAMYKKMAQLNTETSKSSSSQQHRGSSVSSTVSNPASRKESLAT